MLGILAAFLSGCGAHSGGASSRSTLLVSPSVAGTAQGRSPAAIFAAQGPSPAAIFAMPGDSRQPGTQPGGESETTAADFTLNSLDVKPYSLLALAEPLPALTLGEPVLAQQAAEEGSSDFQIEEYDPWEPFNEAIFKFNYKFDRWVLKPVAKAYNFVVPDRIQQMIDHGFDNIKVVPRLVNNVLQWNWRGFATEMGRFLINSTLGIGGLFDIAKQEFHLDKPKGADFGVTLGKWGVKPGPYLVLPFLPPLTVRDGIGYGVDGAIDPLSYVLPFIWDRLGMRLGEIVNERALNLELFQGFEETSVDLYSAVRNGYLQRRYNLIHGIE
jgi:phospholipid-binding lipoprotein MlaA